MKLTTDFYLIKTLTNLHAGSGDTTYGIVDNEVQRDPIDGIPVIHSSSLKGAFREAFSGIDGLNGTITKIFGSDNSARNDDKKDFQAGSHFFFEAKMCVLPLRSDTHPFYRGVCAELMQNLLDHWKEFGYQPEEHIKKAIEFLASGKDSNGKSLSPSKGKPIVFNENTNEISIEYFNDADNRSVEGEAFQNAEVLFGNNLALLHVDDFKELCKKLPVIARNKLESGISANLFYEEVVPRESIFYWMQIRPETETEFQSNLKQLKQRVQIGANATVGYGQCQFTYYSSKKSTP